MKIALTFLFLTGLGLTGCGHEPLQQQARLVPSSCDAGPALPAREHPKFPAHPRFLVAGQSNSVSSAQNHPDYYPQLGLLTINDPDNADWSRMRIPTVDTPSHASISWIYLADMLGVQMTIFNVGVGNTSTRRWVQSLYRRITDALKADHYDAVLWVQGESDVGELIPGEETCANLKAVIQASLEVQPGLDWYVALNSQPYLSKDFPTRIAERTLIDQGWALQGPDTDTLRTHVDYVEPSAVEFTGDGLRAHADLWYQVLKDRF